MNTETTEHEIIFHLVQENLCNYQGERRAPHKQKTNRDNNKINVTKASVFHIFTIATGAMFTREKKNTE